MRRRRRGLVGWVVLAAALVVVAGVASYGLTFRGDQPAATTGLPPATATVTRMTLTETEKVNGTLGYGDRTTVVGRGAGTLTWLPDEGSTVARGQAVFRSDDQAVALLYGSLPLYRPLRSGVTGADVREFEANLSALGYTGFTVDDDFTASTATALRQWQSDLGRTETGRLDVGDVVVAPGAIRVAAHLANVGAQAAGAIVSYTATVRVVDIALDVAKQQLVAKGIRATVTLPDDSTVEGTVTSVGTVATTTTAGQQSTTTIDVVVSIDDQQALGTLDGAPVTATLVSKTKEGVLTVPVAALLALAEGGYGVQVVSGGHAAYTAVTTGLFANGRVEVSGAGIAEGTVVGMPS